jgi:hypothetical protein
MQRILSKGALLAGALFTTLTLTAQQPAKHKLRAQSSDIAVLFSLERAQVAENGTPGFWLSGSIDGSATLYKGLGIAANIAGEHSSNIQSNISLGKFAYMFGPRYTVNTSRYTDRLTKKYGTQIFGEWLFGGVHAFDSAFPGATGVKTSANAFSMQLGGGLDVAMGHGFGIRALEMDYVHTALPNNASNSQNDLRIGFGISYRR